VALARVVEAGAQDAVAEWEVTDPVQDRAESAFVPAAVQRHRTRQAHRVTT